MALRVLQAEIRKEFQVRNQAFVAADPVIHLVDVATAVCSHHVFRNRVGFSSELLSNHGPEIEIWPSSLRAAIAVNNRGLVITVDAGNRTPTDKFQIPKTRNVLRGTSFCLRLSQFILSPFEIEHSSFENALILAAVARDAFGNS